jgi:hypothetical protein
MAKFKQEEEGEDGWSEWVAPIMKGYKIACCDCGLVHDMQFQAMKVTSGSPKGEHRVRRLPASKFVVEFRVRRNNRSTGQLRRHMKATNSEK